MIVVSHDRYFLDKVTTRTWTVRRHGGRLHGELLRLLAAKSAVRVLVERRTYEKQQEEIEKTKDFIRRNAYGQQQRRGPRPPQEAHRIEPVARPREVAEPPMRFSAAGPLRRHRRPAR